MKTQAQSQANPGLKAMVGRTTRLLLINALLSLVMCLCRFDYNIVLSLGLILYLEYHINEYINYYREASYALFFFALVDLIWIIFIFSGWLFSSPAGVAESALFSKFLLWRWIVFLCSLGSLGIKVFVGIKLLGSTNVMGYQPLPEANQASQGQFIKSN